MSSFGNFATSPSSRQVHPIFLVSLVTFLLGVILLTIGGVFLSASLIPTSPDGWVAMLCVGALLIAFCAFFTLIVCCTQRQRLDNYRRRQDAKRLVRLVLRTERDAGRLTSRLTSEQKSRLVRAAMSSRLQVTSHTRVLNELETMATDWRRPPAAEATFSFTVAPTSADQVVRPSAPQLEQRPDPGFEPPPSYEEVVGRAEETANPVRQQKY